MSHKPEAILKGMWIYFENILVGFFLLLLYGQGSIKLKKSVRNII